MRHGQTQWNVEFGATRRDPGLPDPRLTEEGRAQVRRAGEALADMPIVRLITSPYVRALESAEILAEALDPRVEIEIDVRVCERAAFSCDVGTSRSGLAALWGGLASFDHLDETWWHPIEEPESRLHARCEAFRDDMVRRDGWDRTLVVTHWGVIRALTGVRVQNAETIRFDPTVSMLPASRDP